nr:zinc finger CCCH domain-containing protein 19 [Tanacetum cinerariifolium]
MGGFHLFADVAKYDRTNNRLEKRFGDIKPNEGMNTQPVRDNANVFQLFNSYAKAVLGNKSVGVSGNNDVSNSREKHVGVSGSNKTNEESSNEALIFISKDDCIDLDGMERSILAKNLDDDVEKDIEDCSKNLTEKCGVVNNNMSNNVEGEILEDHFDGGRHSEKRWSYRNPDGNVQGSFSLAQLRMWKDYFPSDLKIWSYYGNVKETILLHSALKRRTKDAY